MSKRSDKSGFLLVASPELHDPNFHQTVVLVIQHGDEGTYGLVLNRPLDRSLADVLPDVDPRGAEVPVRQGGPVQTEMLQFVCRHAGDGHEVLPGVNVGIGLEELLEHTDGGDGGRLAFAGYAGWGAGQLERETAEGSWIVAEGQPRHVFDVPPDDLWATVLRDMGGEYGWMSLQSGDPGDN